jgi:methylmalonyl-CoA/ethylmalonyl-CoA epimerase
MIRKIDHLGIAVTSLDEGLALWRDLLGLEPAGVETVAEQGVRTAFLNVGDTRLELIEPTGPDTPVGRFLSKRGPGFHHVCFLVEDLEAAIRELESQGMRLVDREPRDGAQGSKVAFLHPGSTGGVLVELKQKGSAG